MFIKLILILVCSVVSMCTDRHCNVTKHEKTAAVSNKTFELIQDMFLYRDHEDFHFAIPGCMSTLPVSVEDLQTYPNDWYRSEAYRKRYPYETSPGCISGDVRVIPKGTCIRVTYVDEITNSLSGTYMDVFGEILMPEYQGLTVSLFMLMESQLDESGGKRLVPRACNQLSQTMADWGASHMADIINRLCINVVGRECFHIACD